MITLRSLARWFLLILLLVPAAIRHARSQPAHLLPTAPRLSQSAAAAHERSILFAENIGQWSRGVRYQGRAGSTTIRFDTAGVSYAYLVDDRRASGASRFHVLRTEFIGARSDVRVDGGGAGTARYNYYLGADSSTWRLGARGFESVRYSGLYRGVDAVYYGVEGKLKYDFIVAPGADERAIRLRYAGARSLQVLRTGELEMRTEFGAVREAVPFSYQRVAGRVVPVHARYRLIDADTYGFSLGAHDERYPVTIDPCLSVDYATYLGGGGYDAITGLASDSSGAAYVIGMTRAPDFPVIPAAELEQRNWIFISKLSPDGSKLLYSTVIAPAYDGPYGYHYFQGVPQAEMFEPIGEDIEVTAGGDAVFAMTTNFDSAATTPGAFQRKHAADNINSRCGPPLYHNYDCYVGRLNSSGRIAWSSYLGGADNDYVSDIALNAAGDVYLTGLTYAPRCGSSGDALQFPTTIPHDRFGSADSVRGMETFVAVLASDGRSQRFGAIYGGTRDEFATHIALDRNDAVYILGSTNSTDLPTTSNAYEATARPGLGASVFDIYLARINTSSGQLEYSTYFSDNGGAGRRGVGVGILANRTAFSMLGGFDRQHRRQGLAVDNAGGTVLFGGSTRSTTLPTTPGAYQGSARNDAADSSGFDGFVVRLNPSNSGAAQIEAATYLGGNDYDAFGGLVIDRFGDVAVGLSTRSHDFPLSPVSLQKQFMGNADGVIAVLSRDLRSLSYASFYGGAVLPGSYFWEQSVAGLTVDNAGAIYMYGGTASQDFPITPSAVRRANDYYGGYIVKFSAPTSPKIGAGLSVAFEPNLCGDRQTDRQVIFNSGQTAMRIESLGFTTGTNFSLVDPPSLPFMLAPCDTLALTIAFEGANLDCKQKAVDSLVITAPDAVVPRVTLPVTGRRSCISTYFFDTTVVYQSYKLGSNYPIGFMMNVRGAEYQTFTVIPDPGNTGVFTPETPIIDRSYPEGTSTLAFNVNSLDTGYFCEEFTAIIKPCNVVQHLRLCAHVRSGIFTAADTIDYGLISCKEIVEPLVVHNTGNDTLKVSIAYVGGPNPSDISFDANVQKVRKVAPEDSTTFTVIVRPIGVGMHEAVIVFHTDEGGPEGAQRWVYVRSELDSMALHLETADVVGGFGEIVSLPVEYQSILTGRVPLEELTLHVKFNRKLLDVTGVDQSTTIAPGWTLVENTLAKDGANIKLRRTMPGPPLVDAGRLMNLQLKVLRGDTIATPVAIELAGASKGCLYADIGPVTLFQLTAECAAGERLLYSGRRVLKPSVPNPASDMVTIPYAFPEATRATIVLYDAAGRETLRLLDDDVPSGNGALTFDTHALAPGLYYYRLTTPTGIADTRTMVIER